jgi:hypothetical protein
MENDYIFGWLAIARHLKAKRDFPTYSVLCDSPGEAIEAVCQLGMCFGRVGQGMWELRANEWQFCQRLQRAG